MYIVLDFIPHVLRFYERKYHP